jgi:hypothetical protein
MSICEIVHKAPLLRQSRPLLTLRVQRADHYMLHVRTEMRSGQVWHLFRALYYSRGRCGRSFP